MAPTKALPEDKIALAEAFLLACFRFDYTFAAEGLTGERYERGKADYARIEAMRRGLPPDKAVQMWNGVVRMRVPDFAQQALFWSEEG